MSVSKRFKRNDESFEILPNELVVEIFGYLNGVDAVYAFSQLNNRFQSLLDQYVNTFDFKSISKAKFDFVTQHHDIHRWRSLTLSDDDETPGQIKLFCQLFPPAEHISQLKSLSVVNMQPKFAQEVFSHLGSFNHLVSLTIGKIDGKDIQPVEPTSLKRLVVTSCNHTNWMKNLHCLESMEYTFDQYWHDDDVFILPTTLKQLKLFYANIEVENAMRSSLPRLSQLTKLCVYDKGIYSRLPDGGEWEKLIQSSLPLLTTFQFCFAFRSYNNIPETINKVVASFSTPFYLIEKCWFVQCDSSNRYSEVMGVLYSLPFAFTEIPSDTTYFDSSISNLFTSDADIMNCNVYAKVKTIVFNKKCEVSSRLFVTPNMVQLVLDDNLPTNWFFLLTKVRHLRINKSGCMSSTHFSSLLASTPQLQSLSISSKALQTITDQFTNNAVCDQLSEQIQSLTIASYFHIRPDLDVVILRCLPSIVRIFGKRCRHLSLAVSAHPKTVLSILRRMGQLRSLHIYCRLWGRKTQDSVTSWLQEQSTGPADLNFVQMMDDRHYYAWFGDRP